MEQVRLFALGGLDESGKNMYVIEVNDDIFIIEVGLKYPSEHEQLGVEMIIPDFTYLIENKDRIKGIFITHGHDDVLGAIGHLIKSVNIPIYATPFTSLLIKKELQKLKIKNAKIHKIKRNDRFKVSNTLIQTFGVTQSVPDGVGIVIKTPKGSIVYTSEYLMDYDIRNPHFSCDIGRFAEIGKDGVLALLSESVGANNTGYTAPRHRISDIIEPYFESAQGRLLITVYKQNLFRIIEILELAKKYKKRVFFYDESQLELLAMLQTLGYYDIDKDLLISKKEFNKDSMDTICIVSGSGARVFKRMNRIATKEDELVELKENDTVVVASPVVAGTEKEASNMENDLYKEGVNVVTINAKQVYSMHASIEDLKMMIYLFKPKYYIPVKGEYRHLIANANIASSMGYTPDRIVILDNGQIASIQEGHLKSTKEFLQLEETMIDGNEKLDVGGMVLKDRDTLSTDGVIVVGVVINHRTKELIGGPDVQSRGVIYLKDADYIMKQLGDILINTINTAVSEKRYENMQARMDAKDKMNRYMVKETGKRPMILPAIVEINLSE